LDDQGRSWSRHAARYDAVFLDPFRNGVVNPVLTALAAIGDAASRSVVDLGCGTGPLLPHLVGRFGTIVAVDFAPGMIARARARLGTDAARVEFRMSSLDDLDDLIGQFDVAVAINSLVMPDVRAIDRALRAIRGALRPNGRFLGTVPAMDAIHYHTMLLMDRALEAGRDAKEAEWHAGFYAEHANYDFAFGRFRFQGLKQKFWQPFEVEYRLRKAGFQEVELGQVLYPWDEDVPGGAEFADQPRSWDWSFDARA
jgi:SAM-dependent methyltransferase